jgi:phytoene dehydrogenase-like protein
MGRSVIIIGAGIAGLSAGCYTRMNGYDSTIYEMHTIPGGLCTSWKRGDYIFDGSINWLPGSAPDGMFYPLWREVGVIQRCSFIYQDVYCHYAHESGETVVLYYDPVRLRQELLSHSPEDSEAIGEFCGLIETLKGFSPNVAKAQELMSIADYLRMMPDLMLHSKKYRAFLKYGKVTMSEFASKFKSPLLSSMLKFIWGEGHPIALFLAMMAWNSSKTAGYPEGGSLKVAEAMEGRYLSLGGKVRYKSRVESIIVKNGKAAGVRLADGSEQAADIVVSAADGFTTLNRMLGGAYSTEDIKQWYD